MQVTLEWPDSVPTTEFSQQFLQGMLDRMAVSYAKYGTVASAYPRKVDAIKSLHVRLQKYAQTDNLEYLMDAGNFAMIEFMHPGQEDAYYEPTDAKGSPGRAWHGEVDPHQEKNIPERRDR